MGRKCNSCGNEERNKIKAFDDKNRVLYYGMQGTPVYAKKYRCGVCGNEFSDDDELGELEGAGE